MSSVKKSIENYLHHCNYGKNLSSKTIKAYETDLKQFVNLLQRNKHSLSITDISKSEIQQYIEDISTYKPKTRKRKIATLKALLNFLEYEDTIANNPLRKMQIKIKIPFDLPKCLSIEEVNKIYKAAYGDLKNRKEDSSCYKTSLRNIVVIELLFSTGARVSEISNLENQDVDLKTGRIQIKGKGNKERVVHIYNNNALKSIIEYKKLVSANLKISGRNFLLNRLGNRLTEQSIRKIIKILSEKAKISKNVTPHIFRHTFASLLLENDVDIKHIQFLLGHSSIITTQIYTHVNNTKVNHILKTRHPRKYICFD